MSRIKQINLGVLHSGVGLGDFLIGTGIVRQHENNPNVFCHSFMRSDNNIPHDTNLTEVFHTNTVIKKDVFFSLRILKKMNKKKITHLIVPTGKSRSPIKILSTLSGIKVFTFDNSFRKHLYHQTISSSLPVYDRWAKLTRNLDPEKLTGRFRPKIPSKLTSNETNQTICIAPGAGDSSRRMKPIFYLKMAEFLQDQYPAYNILFFVSPEEKEDFPNLPYDHTGAISLDESINLMSRSKLVITNDSAPLHIAYSLDKQTIPLFRSVTDPEQWSPPPYLENVVKLDTFPTDEQRLDSILSRVKGSLENG